MERELSQSFFDQIKTYELLDRAYDYYLPGKLQLSIGKVNYWYLINLPVFPLMMVTPLLNPYRTYQFFFARKHCFVNYKYSLEIELNEGEGKKSSDIVWCFRQALTDMVSLLATILILITGFRAIYLITILSLNGHVTYFNNGFLTRLARNNPRLHIKLR